MTFEHTLQREHECAACGGTGQIGDDDPAKDCEACHGNGSWTEEIQLIVEGEFYAPCRGARDGRYGPAIEPDDPGGWELDDYRRKDGQPITLSDSELDEIDRAAVDHLPDPYDGRDYDE